MPGSPVEHGDVADAQSLSDDTLGITPHSCFEKVVEREVWLLP
jgi:hypothetical protein